MQTEKKSNFSSIKFYVYWYRKCPFVCVFLGFPALISDENLS